MRSIGAKIRESSLDKTVKAEQTRVLSQFLKRFFHSNNERVRIHPANEKNRKSDYYTDIISCLPEETRCFNVSSRLEPVRENRPPCKEPCPLPEDEHPWGSYVPQGIAEIRTADGKTVLAAGDSLLLKAKGIEKAKMFREELYDGLDNPAQDFNYTLERLIPFSDMVSVQRAEIEPDSVSLHEIESISFDRSARRISRSVTARSH